MKRFVSLLISLVMLLGMAACGTSDNKREEIYFITLPDAVEVDGEYAEQPQKVLYYSGGESLKAVYTLPGSIACLAGSTLYYELDDMIYTVILPDGSAKEYAPAPEGMQQLFADENGVYALCRTVYGAPPYTLWHIKPDAAARIDENGVVGNMTYITTGGGNLFYIEDSEEHILMRYDTETGETVRLAEQCYGPLTYDGGYVYTGLTETIRVQTETGEKSFVHKGAGTVVRDGWLYCSSYMGCEETGYCELFRRHLDSDKIELCGEAYLPYIEMDGLKLALTFGSKGFIAHSTRQNEATEYIYFPYGNTDVIPLSVQ